MIAALHHVEIPGYAEAVRHERAVRDCYWVAQTPLLCGVEIVPLSLRRLLWLEQARCGLVVPWSFDDGREAVAHAALFIWMLRPQYIPPTSPRFRFFAAWREHARAARFMDRLLRYQNPAALLAEVSEYIADCFMDAPSAQAGTIGQSYASYPVYVLDHLAAAGYSLTMSEVFDLPLVIVWQLLRVSGQRLGGARLTNPSDQIAVDWLAQYHPGAN